MKIKRSFCIIFVTIAISLLLIGCGTEKKDTHVCEIDALEYNKNLAETTSYYFFVTSFPDPTYESVTKRFEQTIKITNKTAYRLTAELSVSMCPVYEHTIQQSQTIDLYAGETRTYTLHLPYEGQYDIWTLRLYKDASIRCLTISDYAIPYK